MASTVDQKHSEAVAEGGGQQHRKLGHPKIIVHLGNTISGKSGSNGSTEGSIMTHGPPGGGQKGVDQEGGKKNPHIPGAERTPPPHGPRPGLTKPTPGLGLPSNGNTNGGGGGLVVAGHHPEGMMRCARCSCIYTECQCGKSRQVGMPYCPNPNTADVVSACIHRKSSHNLTFSQFCQNGLVFALQRGLETFIPGC